MSSPAPADRNLIFGLLALQMDFVTREQLLDAMHAWMLRKATPLVLILRERGVLTERRADLLSGLVEEHVARHGGPQGSLASLRVEPLVRQDLHRLEDADVQANIAALSATPLELAIPATHVGVAHEAVADPAASALAAANPGTARFRRLREHAKGGLGEVFVALDEELRREVALKEIQERFADQPDARARFLREAKVTGSLEHPGVVPVYGLGAYPDGRPYYAMRFIRGESMHEAIARFHQADENPRRDRSERSLALRDLLSRFVAACNAVAYAHARGVIHRDLKPANVMLGEYGETLVVDWGLTRLLDQPAGEQTAAERPVLPGSGRRSPPTEMGQVVGTPAYMPPEQAGGRIDQVGVRSDVYSLGATLYCIVTGMSPYPGDNADEILQQVRAHELVAPRRIKRAVPIALEAVILKAMSYAQADRYRSAHELAQEVERFLADEPVLAYREPPSERIARWARRNRSLVSVALVVLLTGVVGLSVGLWAVGREQARTMEALVEARDNLVRAVQAEEKAKANLARAEDNLKLARRAVDECFNVAREHLLFKGPRMEKAKKLLLEKTLPFYKNFRSQRPEDRHLRRDEADQWFRVGFIEHTLMRTTEARTAYERARNLQQNLGENHPDAPDYQNDLANTHLHLGRLLLDLGGREEALKEWQQARDLGRKLVKAHPDQPAYQNILASARSGVGGLLNALGRDEEALEELQQGRDLFAKLVQGHPGVAKYQINLAAAHQNLGGLLSVLGLREEALKEHRQARDIGEKLVQDHPDVAEYQQELARTHVFLGRLFSGLGRREEALKEYGQARDLGQRLIQSHPDVPNYQDDLARTHIHLGQLLSGLGRREEALKEYGQARDLGQRLIQSHPDVPGYQHCAAFTHDGLAQLLSALGRGEEALKEHLQARDLFAKLAKDHPDVPQYRSDLARTRAPGTLYNRACIYALKAASDARDATRPLPEREKRAEAHARQAIASLERAASAGHFRDARNVATLDGDEDLAFLRDRDDFKRFRASLKLAK
jgi:serine/threonine-protein kinase